MVSFKHKGNFKNTERLLNNTKKLNYQKILDFYGQEGVRALASATPVDTGLTASSWGYTTSITKSSYIISWTNTNVNNGVPIVILLQYGYGTRNGGYVQGRDYINPALQPILDKIVNAAWREVTKR